MIAIDTAAIPAGVLPRFDTSRLLDGTMFDRRNDLGRKRNLGLMLARTAGWSRVVFLDDDVAIPDPQDLRVAAGLLDSYEAVGLASEGFPDNSVVCHAYREVGGAQDVFIGGGALAVAPDRTDSFFPDIYDEDWFFLLDRVKLRPAATTGVAKHNAYDPFGNEVMARQQELGDCIAEGLFWLLDHGRRVQDADPIYWAHFLGLRRDFIMEVIERTYYQDIEPADKRRKIAALKAARGRSQRIGPDLCVDYLRAWSADRTRWRRHLDELPVGIGAEGAIAALGLSGNTRISDGGLRRNVSAQWWYGGSVSP